MKLSKYLTILFKLVHTSIKKGKRAKSLKIFLFTFKYLQNHVFKLSLSFPKFLHTTFNNILPILHWIKYYRRKKFHYLPRLLNTEQEFNLGMNWLFNSLSTRNEYTTYKRLTCEILDCYNGIGSTITKKQNCYDIILTGRPFLHFLVYRK